MFFILNHSYPCLVYFHVFLMFFYAIFEVEFSLTVIFCITKKNLRHHHSSFEWQLYDVFVKFCFQGNNKHDQEAMDATFYLSNIVPQDLDNNAGFWYRIEAYCRGLTKRYSDVYVISGPLHLPREEDGKKIVRYEVKM